MIEWLFSTAFLGCLLIQTYTDLRYMLLYDKVHITMVIVGLLYVIYKGDILQGLSGAVVCFGIMLLLYLVSRGGMGEGDVKFSFVLGLWLGVEQGLAGLLLAFVIGAISGIALLAVERGEKRRMIPFGPFMAIGAGMMYFYGSEVLAWYYKLYA